MAWRGNPVKPSVNSAPNKVNHGLEKSEMKQGENRALNMRRDKDTTKDFSVTLIDVDTTIFNYLDTTINPTVTDSGRLVKVPVNYASPEKWKAIKKDGYMRDKQGKIQTPAMVFRRSTMQRNDNLITFNRYLQYPTMKLFSEKNKYDKFSLMTGFKPVKEVYSVALPDHVIINYDFIVWTNLVEQGNSVIERINFATEDYWGTKGNFTFRTSISDYNFQVETPADNDRIVKTTFSMMVYAYLLPDRYENYKATVQKAFTNRKIVVNAEATGRTVAEAEQNLAIMTELNGKRVPVIDEKVVVQEPAKVGQSNFPVNAFNYQSFLATKTGSVVTIDNGSGSSVFLFENTSFNQNGTTTNYEKFMLFVDDRTVNPTSLTYFISGSNLIANVVNSVSGVTPTTSSLIVGYGNIN